MYCTIYETKTRALISCMVIAADLCLSFRICKRKFSHDVVHIHSISSHCEHGKSIGKEQNTDNLSTCSKFIF